MIPHRETSTVDQVGIYASQAYIHVHQWSSFNSARAPVAESQLGDDGRTYFVDAFGTILSAMDIQETKFPLRSCVRQVG